VHTTSSAGGFDLLFRSWGIWLRIHPYCFADNVLNFVKLKYKFAKNVITQAAICQLSNHGLFSIGGCSVMQGRRQIKAMVRE
jgi:hypothetical protein